MSKVPLTPIKERVIAGLISERKHPTLNLWIYNYTPRVQYSHAWDEYTIMCRGLILDAEGNIIARPFKKFFSLDEYQDELPNEPFTVHEKADGSLGILYWDNNVPRIATRGSFESDQARVGSRMLLEELTRSSTFEIGYSGSKTKPTLEEVSIILPEINRKYTYLFEIIYPGNRIVVNYGNERRLVLLAIINTETGEELPIKDCELFKDKAIEYDGIKDIAKLTELVKNTDNREGFVVRFLSGLRLKFKFEEYVRLHRILTQVSNKTIWELLKNGQPIEPILDNIPDEMYQWVMKTYEGLQTNFLRIKDEAMIDFEGVSKNGTIREKAEYIKQQRYPAVNFMMLQGKSIDQLVWKMIKPRYEQPFKVDIDS